MQVPDEQSVPPGMIAVGRKLLLPRSALRFSYSRSSGPGGQNVNKVSTRVQMRIAVNAIEELIGKAATHRLVQRSGVMVTDSGDVLLVCDETRSQVTNKQRCITRLIEMLRQARVKPPVRRATKPGKAVKQRRIDEKKKRSGIKKYRKRPRMDE